MAMISDVDYILQAIRLACLRNAEDPLTSRIISLDPSFALNPYINASGLSDIDRWPEIKRALDSPPPEVEYSSSTHESSRDVRAARSDRGLKYTQTIMGPGRSGGAGMRVSGRTAAPGEAGAVGRRAQAMKTQRAKSSSAARGPPPPVSPMMTTNLGQPVMDAEFFSPSGRPRADSAPMPILLGAPSGLSGATSMMTTARLGVGGVDSGAGLLEQAMSASEASGDVEDNDEVEDIRRDFSPLGMGGYEAEDSSMGVGESAQPSDMGLITGDASGPLGQEIADEGSDLDDEDIEEDVRGVDQYELDRRKRPVMSEDDGSSSAETAPEEPLLFAAVPLSAPMTVSGLTATLNKHVPHLVSTSTVLPNSNSVHNPFASLYTSVSAPPALPSISLELYFPHSAEPAKALRCKVRKDASVEEVTGFGLFKFWEEGREPRLTEEEREDMWTTVGWGLRIVEDDGEVDEDFPPLDRDSQVSKFSYGQFAIVEATDAQVRQNAAKAPHIQRRPSRIIAQPNAPRPSARTKQNFTQQPAARGSTTSISSSEMMPLGTTAMKGSVGLGSALSKPVLLRVRVTASADVHFTTTISVPSDMYIADLTEVLCKRKRLQNPASEWVLCLADLTLALPLDRTVASLEGRTDLALVRRQWAVEHGLHIGDRRGGDPSASIFKRVSEPTPLSKFGPGLADFSQTYKKYNVQRKIAIGRHERVLAIDGDYIHIMPSESRAFFDSMKTTSFHITLVASCKLTGRAGGFKINVWRDVGQKRYEFEAENGQQASEIISTIRNLMKTYATQRSSALPAPRRMR